MSRFISLACLFISATAIAQADEGPPLAGVQAGIVAAQLGPPGLTARHARAGAPVGVKAGRSSIGLEEAPVTRRPKAGGDSGLSVSAMRAMDPAPRLPKAGGLVTQGADVTAGPVTTAYRPRAGSAGAGGEASASEVAAARSMPEF